MTSPLVQYSSKESISPTLLYPAQEDTLLIDTLPLKNLSPPDDSSVRNHQEVAKPPTNRFTDGLMHRELWQRVVSKEKSLKKDTHQLSWSSNRFGDWRLKCWILVDIIISNSLKENGARMSNSLSENGDRISQVDQNITFPPKTDMDELYRLMDRTKSKCTMRITLNFTHVMLFESKYVFD
jgi:hypothetical protein